MDTTLIPAIVRVRASRKGLFWGQATFGRSASKTEWVYGFKAALVVDPNGVVSAFGLAPAASEERPIGEALLAEDHYDAYLAYSRASQGSSGSAIGWSNTGRLLLPPPTTIPAERGRRPNRRWASGKRQIIEGVSSASSRTTSLWSAIGPRRWEGC